MAATHIITTVEIIDANEQSKAIADLGEYLSMLFNYIPMDFDDLVRLMETSLKFNCEETAHKIKKELKDTYPSSWKAYKDSHESDASSADGSDAR
jgi:hypothetical protein